MDIQQLRYFVCAAERRSFREAAEALYVSRSTLSKSITRLEDELGYALFRRNHVGATLTELGERFYNEAMPLVENYDRVSRMAKSVLGSKSIVVAIPNSWAEFFSGAIEAFERSCPELRVSVASGPDAECNQRARRGEIDLLVTHLPFDGGVDEGLPLVRAPLYYAMSENNPLARKDLVTLDDLVDQDVIYYPCGYEKVFWVPPAKSRSHSFDNDILHIYARLYRNEGVMPTPLITAPTRYQGVVYRRYEGPYDTVVMKGHVIPHPGRSAEREREIFALRNAMVISGNNLLPDEPE